MEIGPALTEPLSIFDMSVHGSILARCDLSLTLKANRWYGISKAGFQGM